MEWIRNARIDWKTGVFVIVLAIAVWGVVIYVNLRDFVPEEITQPTPSNRP